MLKRIRWSFSVAALVLLGALAITGCGSNSKSSSGGTTATPTFSPGGGTYNSSQSVTVSDSTPGAVLYCTTDGTTPTTSSPQCAQPTVIYKTQFLQAIAVAAGSLPSAVASAGYVIDLKAVATPTFSPAGGTYSDSQQVTITDATSGANIYYTTDGSAPSASSTLYTGPIAVSSSQTLRAIAVASGYNNSGIANADYVIQQKVETPVFTPVSGTYSSAQTVTISDATPQAKIYYALNGATPSVSSTLYTGPITVAQTGTISAIAILGSTSSSIATVAYQISVLQAPVVYPASGTITAGTQVVMLASDSSASIYYTKDGSTPTSSSTKYTGPVTLSAVGSTTIKAIAVGASGSSAVTTTTYNVTSATTPQPVFNPADGSSIVSGSAVTITDANSSAVIYYTLDGSTPTASSTRYVGPVTLSSTGAVTIKALAISSGSSSSVSSATYTVTASGTPLPTFTPADGATVTAGGTVMIANTDSHASIYYTLDGSEPTSASTQYTGPIILSTVGTVQVKAIAIEAGVSSSSVTATYTVVAAQPSISIKALSGTATPVNGAQVQLYAAGQAGYGSPGMSLASGSTDNQGMVNLTYTCPAAPGDLVYVVASHGDAGAGPNTALQMMTALGSCNSLSNSASVVVNEATTIASAYALGQFITTTPDVGSSSTNYKGLRNAFATVGNLVDITTGTVRTITPAYAFNQVAFLHTSTVPNKRINTLANLLNGCVSGTSASAGCSNLFTSTTNSAGTPANTLQAAVNLARNPGANVSALFGLASPAGPYQPVLTAAPGDLAIALTYTGGGLGISPSTVATVTIGSNTFSNVGPIVNTSMAIDGDGNVWVTAYGYDGVAPFNIGSGIIGLLSEFSNLGAPLTPDTTLSADTTPVVTFGGLSPSSDPLNDLTIDQSENVWAGTYTSGSMFVYSPNRSPVSIATPIVTGTGARSMAVDANNMLWIGSSNLYEYSLDGTPTSLLYPNGQTPTITHQYGSLTKLFFDAIGNLWGLGSSSVSSIYQIDTATGGISYEPFPDGISNRSGMAADGSGNVYVCGGGPTELDTLSGTSQSQIGSSTLTATRGCGLQMLVDGVGNLIAISNSASAPKIKGIDIYTSAGISLSPSTGYLGAGSEEDPTLNTATSASKVPGKGAAIDGSGNLWVLNPTTAGATATGNVLVEFVGLVAPVTTPNSLALKSGTLGSRP